MCDGISSPEKRDGRRDEEFYVNASFITKKSFLHFIKGYPRQEYVPPWPKPHDCVYPKANSYYAFNEDVNPFTRFTGKCQSRKYGNVQPHYEPSEQPYATRDPYRETEATQKYLQTKPTCFAVFGKPGLNIAELAAMIADAWNCVLISPVHLVNQEIEQGTENGKTIVDILRSGERLGPDVIMSLVENRIGKRDVLHRGYVVEGLPLIPNETLDYSSYDRNSNEDDENLALNYAKLHGSSFERICSTPGDLEQCQRSAISSDREFKDNACAVRPNYEGFIYNQVEEIFTTWPIKPSIVIYATCPDADVARKRERLRTDAATGRVVDTSFLGKGKSMETMFSDDKTGNDANVSLEFHRKFAREEETLDDHRRKYLLKRPCDGKSNVEAQCKLYKRFAMPAIEKWTLLHKPENVIRVDGRVPVSRMFQITVSRLRLLPVPRMILPKRSMDPAAVKFDDESPPTIPANEFESKSNEEAFQYLMNRETVSPMYPWRLSSWNFLCPVELARGKTVEGLSKYAVKFMNKMFFLSSEETMELFLENPRTFLLPFAPRPTCKMAVFGPKYSGKSDLCKKLARVFRGTMVDSKETDSYSFSDFSTYTDVEEDTRVIIKKIQDIPKEEIDIDVWRDGGYVVDGMYPDLQRWRTIVEDQKIVFEDAILLFDEEPYEYLISKWNSIHEVKQESRDEMEGEYMDYSEGTTNKNEEEEEEEETRGLADYLRHVRQFELDWEDAKETIAKSCKSLITCNVGKIDNVSEYVIENIEARYADKARIMSDEEKEREKDLAEYMAMADTTEIVGEEDEAEGEGRATELEFKDDNRPFGDTNDYCPVALLRYNVFWKGKEDFSAIFMNRIYLLSSATALEEFVRSPQVFSLPFRKPLSTIPPLRISIIGPTGCGKSIVADAISREYGLVHVDYFDNFATYTKDRQMFPLSRRGVLVSPNDLSEEVELPEDLDDRRYSTDEATVQTFVRRYWKEGGILPKRMLRECLLAFFEEHYNLHGVVLDRFPSCPQDWETAIKHYAIPEMIIELQCGRAKARERMIPELLKLWQDVTEEKKRVEYLRYTVALSDYESDAEVWIQKMLRETIEELHMGEGERFSYSYEDDDSSDSSDPSFGIDPEIIESKRLELDEQWRRENPEPVLFTDWEDFETARHRIEEEFEKMYDVDAEMMVATRTALENESIPYAVIDGERDIKEIILQIMRMLTPYAKRDVSVLEKTYTADLETAEMLLDCGYYLQSSFGRWCPVQLRENAIPLQMFLPLEARQEIYPVIHRGFIYFLGGKDARSAFLKNPLSYVEQDSCAPVVPFRLSIIGPPKCGKTTLARRFATKYGIKMVTRGAALRHVLKHFPWTESAESTESVLRAGHLAPEESLHRAVEMYSVDPCSTSQGLVLDGFPVNRKEYEALTFLGVQPMVVLDLKANLAFCLECLSREADETNKPLNFSDGFLAHRYESWNVGQGNYRDWLGKFAQNVIEIDATRSTWHVWTRADREVCSRYAKIRSYFRESDYDKPHSLTFMNVSPYEFKQRQSRFESYCPLCLFHENIMKTSGPPPNHRGMVQFREHFYWICPRHMDDFVKNPEKHLPPINTARLPEDRPRVLTEEVDVEHPCWAKRLRVDGFCLVTYADNLPSRRLVRGKSSIGVLYKDEVYLFCTEECRDRFLTSSEKYSNVDIKFLRTLAPIDIKDLPNLGFLEQTVAKVIVEAVNQVSVIRPKLPGLSSSATAAIFIGVYLKTRNVSCAMKETKIYDGVSYRIFGLDKIFKVATRAMKKKLNPFVSGPEYQDDDDMDPNRISRHLSMLTHVYKRPSVFLTFRRTSPTQMFVDPSEVEVDD